MVRNSGMRQAPLASASGFLGEIGKRHLCALPILTDCTAASPALSASTGFLLG